MKKLLMTKKIGFVFLGVISLHSGTAACAAVENTRIAGVQGKAHIVRGGQAMPAEVGAKIQDDDILKTEAGGILDVSIDNQAGGRILSSSESSVVSTDAGQMRVKVMMGDILLNVEKLPRGSSFKVETPTAIASVRGTQFSCHVDNRITGNPVASFAVREDAVDVSILGTGETITVAEGRALDIPKNLTGPLATRSAFGIELANLEQSSTIHTCS